ncbi:MAG: TlpA family protein disulfide reductase [Planctomycetota bacterium]
MTRLTNKVPFKPRNLLLIYCCILLTIGVGCNKSGETAPSAPAVEPQATKEQMPASVPAQDLTNSEAPPQSQLAPSRAAAELAELYSDIQANIPPGAGPGNDKAANAYLFSNLGRINEFIKKHEGMEEASFARLLRASAWTAGGAKKEAIEDIEYILQVTRDIAATDEKRMWLRMDSLQLYAQLNPAATRTALDPILKANNKFSRRALKLVRLANAAELLKLDSPMLAFQCASVDGTAITNDIFQGKAYFIYFWTSVSSASLDPIASLRKLHLKYKDSGFEIVNVCFDTNEIRSVPGYGEPLGLGVEAVKTFVKKSKMPGISVYEPRGLESDLAEMFCIDAIPAAILVDKNGKIRQLGYDGAALAKNLKDIFGK